MWTFEQQNWRRLAKKELHHGTSFSQQQQQNTFRVSFQTRAIMVVARDDDDVWIALLFW